MFNDKDYNIKVTNKGLELTNEHETFLLKNMYGLNFISRDDGETWIQYLTSHKCPHCHGIGKIYK